jgi:hypothetical protein
MWPRSRVEATNRTSIDLEKLVRELDSFELNEAKPAVLSRCGTKSNDFQHSDYLIPNIVPCRIACESNRKHDIQSILDGITRTLFTGMLFGWQAS